MNRDRKPLPKFWYFPKGEKAVVVMTGDDHANGGTAGRFDTYIADSPNGCSVADWECVRSTSYIYTATPLTDAQAASYDAEGFEIGLHVTTNCTDFTPTSLETTYATQLSDWNAKYAQQKAELEAARQSLTDRENRLADQANDLMGREAQVASQQSVLATRKAALDAEVASMIERKDKINALF